MLLLDSVSQCKIAWHKDGGLIAIPCEKEVHFYERETWSCKFKIQVPADGEFTTSIVDFSPCGKYVLATTSTSMVYVFSIINNAMLFKYSYNKKMKLCSLAWNPSDQSQLLFCDDQGNMGNIKVVLNDDSLMETSPVKSKAKKKTDDNLGIFFLIQKSGSSVFCYHYFWSKYVWLLLNYFKRYLEISE